MKYHLKLYGIQIEGSSHFISNDTVGKVKKMMLLEGYNKYVDCQERIEEMIGWNKFNSNMFYFSKPEYDQLKLELYEYNHLINDFHINQIPIIDRRDEYVYYSVPSYDWYHNILVSIEMNKGPICIYEFDSQLIPTLEDFSAEIVFFETHNQIFKVINDLYFCGVKLVATEFLPNNSFKNSLKIWTLDDIHKDMTTN